MILIKFKSIWSMIVELKSKADEIRNNIIKNAFLIAIINRLDLSSIVRFVDKTIKEVTDQDNLYEEYTGLLFAELLSSEMNIPLQELINSDKDYQKGLIEKLINVLSLEGSVLDIYKSESIDEESYITFLVSGLSVYEKNAEFIPAEVDLPSDGEESEQKEYLVEVVLVNKTYIMSVLTNNIEDSKYFTGHIEVWREDKGLLADFVDIQLDDNDSLAFKEGLSEEELVACVFEDTRTMNLLDVFEGYGDKNDKTYQRIVIKNGMLFRKYGDPYLHLIIERRTSGNVVGDITFTKFKKGDIEELRRFIYEEIDEDILRTYLDKDHYYMFSSGYLLRAQYSKNRSGYGSGWKWINGVRTYVHGTEYGETTEYVFSGVYISSKYLFNSEERSPMLKFTDTDLHLEIIDTDPLDLEYEYNKLADENNDKEEGLDFDITIGASVPIDINVNKKNNVEPDTEEIFDIEKLRTEENRPVIHIGSKVKYKKMHTGEIMDVVIKEENIVHKKMIGKQQGDFVGSGNKRYLIVKVEE